MQVLPFAVTKHIKLPNVNYACTLIQSNLGHNSYLTRGLKNVRRRQLEELDTELFPLGFAIGREEELVALVHGDHATQLLLINLK
jgi:hypothetical protein